MKKYMGVLIGVSGFLLVGIGFFFAKYVHHGTGYFMFLLGSLIVLVGFLAHLVAFVSILKKPKD